jgi:alpha-glucosidase
MPQVPIPPDRVHDPFEKKVPGIGVGRDGARTPMQWDPGDFAGFSTVEPWLPISRNFRTENVENELREPSSIYNLYLRLISAPRQRPALSAGSYRTILAERDLLVYMRQAGSERVLIALNLGSELISTPLPSDFGSGRVLVSSFGDLDGEPLTGRVELRGDEGLVIGLLESDGTADLRLGA